MNFIYYIVAVLIGAAAAVQVGVNSSLKISTGSPILASFANFSVGWLAIFVLLMIQQKGQVGEIIQSYSGLEKWKFTGGLLGSFFVTSLVIVTPKIGMTSTLTLVIAGQLVLALILDHFGWLGMQQQPISWMKILGIGIMVLGVWIIQKF
ncbi:DMT family transporter [Persicobacter diffluens]|uniref:Membrane protein n=1 Tax=Persicobacter diffluens TaxID=981 RepID=A0AAN5AL02_9BACT|nr:membrane protein [Persicobacter diffluens]